MSKRKQKSQELIGSEIHGFSVPFNQLRPKQKVYIHNDVNVCKEACTKNGSGWNSFCENNVGHACVITKISAEDNTVQLKALPRGDGYAGTGSLFWVVYTIVRPATEEEINAAKRADREELTGAEDCKKIHMYSLITCLVTLGITIGVALMLLVVHGYVPAWFARLFFRRNAFSISTLWNLGELYMKSDAEGVNRPHYLESVNPTYLHAAFFLGLFISIVSGVAAWIYKSKWKDHQGYVRSLIGK